MVDVVVGGLYGDEGKGKIVGYLARNYNIIVRVGGGPQAGHTVTNGKFVTLLPSGFTNPDAELYVCAVINPDKLLAEAEEHGAINRLKVDKNCTIIFPEDIEREAELKKTRGSVGSGTGIARINRIMRKEGIRARDVDKLKPFLIDIGEAIRKAHRQGKEILAETAHGYGLSLFGEEYPYSTTEIVSTAQALAYLDLAPQFIYNVFVVYKPWTSRVGIGHPLPGEWTRDEIVARGILERGTVSGRERRAAPFDYNLAERSLLANGGTDIVLTNVDRYWKGNFGVTDYDKLTPEAKQFISDLEKRMSNKADDTIPVSLISTGPDLEHVIDLA